MSSSMTSISYMFHLANNEDKVFEIIFDQLSLTHIMPEGKKVPEWGNTFKCQYHADLKKKTNCCKLFKSLVFLFQEFKDYSPDDTCTISVRTEERNYTIRGTVKKGLFSILGLYMATSACPYLAFLKPMARFHLPFSSAEETVFRSSGAYLIGELIRHKEGKAADLELSKLRAAYEKVSVINQDITNGLKAKLNSNKSLDAVAILDHFAKLISEDIFEKLNDFKFLYDFSLRDNEL